MVREWAGAVLTPDPYKAASNGNDPTAPQSWNRYAYVQGDPANYIDPRGLFIEQAPPLDPSSGGDPLACVDIPGGDLALMAGYPGCAGPDPGQAPSPLPTRAPPPPDPCPGYIRNFFNVVIPFATTIATKWSTSVNDVLAVSAFESGWLGQHAQDLHNLFGLTNKGGANRNFPGGYQDSANYFSAHYGTYIQGKTDINAFAAALQPHYNTHAAYWIGTLINTYTSVLKWRIICDQ